MNGTADMEIVSFECPKTRNALDSSMFSKLRTILQTTKAKVIVLKANTSGLNLKEFVLDVGPADEVAIGILKKLEEMQLTFSMIEHCKIPVIALVSGHCIGAGVDMICVCDIRVCSKDAVFSIREIDLAMAADLGTLQRLPRIVGNSSLIYEWAFTGRNISAQEALRCGLVSIVLDTPQEALDYAVKLANVIASKHGPAIEGIKDSLRYAKSHSVQDGLERIALRNASMLQTSAILDALLKIKSKI